MTGVKPYWERILLGLDQLANTLLDGNEDETISSRVGRNALAGKKWALIAQSAINALFKFLTGKPDHCYRSIEWDELTSSDTQ